MLPALADPDGLVNITRQNNSETSGFDRGRCVLTTSCRNTALAAAWIDQMYAPIQSPQNNWGTYGKKIHLISLRCPRMQKVVRC